MFFAATCSIERLHKNGTRTLFTTCNDQKHTVQGTRVGVIVPGNHIQVSSLGPRSFAA